MDNKLVLIGYKNGMVEIYSKKTGELLANIIEHLKSIIKIEFIKSSQSLIISSNDGLIKV